MDFQEPPCEFFQARKRHHRIQAMTSTADGHPSAMMALERAFPRRKPNEPLIEFGIEEMLLPSLLRTCSGFVVVVANSASWVRSLNTTVFLDPQSITRVTNGLQSGS